MKKHRSLFIIVAIIVIAIALYYVNSHKSQPWLDNQTTENTQVSSIQQASKDDQIIVSSPLPNQEVTSPLTINGQARGTWYFEAVFPVKLVDATGKVLAQGQARTQSNWTTSEYAPFIAQLTFTKPTTSTGTIILSKDNPSGLPQNDNELRIPVKLKEPSL